MTPTRRAQPSARCRAMLEKLSAYVDGEISPAQCARIEAHCQGCACCARLVENLRRTVGLCQQTQTGRLPADVRTRARQRIADLLQESGSTPAGVGRRLTKRRATTQGRAS